MIQMVNIQVMLDTNNCLLKIKMRMGHINCSAVSWKHGRIITSGICGSAVTGTYGQLTLNSNGSYTYVANQAADRCFDAGDNVYDYFNYTCL